MIRDYNHKISNLILEFAKKYGVSCIVVGKLQENKNKESKLSSTIDQMLNFLPHDRVSKQIEYKAKEYGIKTVLVGEGYTLSVDSLKNPTVLKENYTPEVRKHRGLFKSSPNFFRVYGQIDEYLSGIKLTLSRQTLCEALDFNHGLFTIII